MRETASLVASALTVLVVTGLIMNSNRALRQLASLPFNPLLVPAENAFKALLLAFVVGLAALGGRPWAAYGAVPPAWRDLALGGGLGLACLACVHVIRLLAVGRWGAAISSPLVIRAIMPRQPRQWPGVLVAMMLAVAVEEALFRALPLGSWAPPLPAWLALALAAGLFGSLHSVQGPLGVALATALGAVLGLALRWSSSLWVPLLAHYLFNLGQLLIAVRWPALLDTPGQQPLSS